MKKKYILAAFALGISISAKVIAQVPGYVPTNGIVGWWPFNGNANDQSGVGNNGTVNGATLTIDRFGNTNSAYNFAGGTDRIIINNSLLISNPSSYSISLWVLNSTGVTGEIMCDRSTSTYDYKYRLTSTSFENLPIAFATYSGNSQSGIIGGTNNQGNWSHVVTVADITTNTTSLFVNGQLVGTDALFYPIHLNATTIGANVAPGFPGYDPSINGKIDDIGMWNRVLTDQEISALYNNCSGDEITTQPANSVNTIGSNAQLSVNAAVGSTYQWQNNPLNNGWQNVNDNSTYSGATTNLLTVSNTSVSNHNQPFRAIVNAGGCIDTSNVAQIIIGDTCLTTVTDTLIINTTLGFPVPNNENTILIYPNPASDHITIDNGNYTAMAGYTIKIENNAGQQVFQSLINQAQFYVDLSTWSGNGLYFVHLIDAQGNTVTVRKIVLQ